MSMGKGLSVSFSVEFGKGRAFRGYSMTSFYSKAAEALKGCYVPYFTHLLLLPVHRGRTTEQNKPVFLSLCYVSMYSFEHSTHTHTHTHT
jgi:hypothetical protein